MKNNYNLLDIGIIASISEYKDSFTPKEISNVTLSSISLEDGADDKMQHVVSKEEVFHKVIIGLELNFGTVKSGSERILILDEKGDLLLNLGFKSVKLRRYRDVLTYINFNREKSENSFGLEISELDEKTIDKLLDAFKKAKTVITLKD